MSGVRKAVVMASTPSNGNGVYIVTTDGIRIPIRRTVLLAIKRMIDEKKTGTVTIDFRDGGIATVRDSTVYQNG